MTSPGGGGSSGVGGGPPRSGMDIVRNMFDQAQAKPLETAQQAANLSEQTRTQEQTRETVRQSDSQSHTEGAPREGENRGADGARPRDVAADRPVRESEMDGFLARTSQQQQQREAGRNLTRPQQSLGTINAQAWSVGNSPNTPEAARTILQQRMQQGQMQGNTPQTTLRAMTGNPQGLMERPMPLMPRAPLGGNLPEQAMPLLITYARAFSSGGETAARAFTGSGFNPENFMQSVQRMMQAQMGAVAQQLFATGLPVAVQVRGNLVFVKDGKEFRAFKLNKDGSLTELASEDGGEHPLSPEAQKLLGKVLGQRSLHARKEGGQLKDAEKLVEAEAERLQEGRAEGRKEAEGEVFDFETRFALLLHEVLEEGRDIEKTLGEGKDPTFPTKSDWAAFFAKMLKVGNQEKDNKKMMDAVLNMVFRGLFKKEGQGNVMVGDIKFLQDEKTREEKFAQVSVDDETFLKLLASLKPGQKISREQLKAVFGDELSYVELDHIAEQLHSKAEEFAKNVIFNPKGNIDAFSQARLERSIFGNRKPEKLPTLPLESESAALLLSDPGPQSVPANVFEILGLRERYRGKPRLYTFIFYMISLSVLGIAVGSVLLKYL